MSDTSKETMLQMYDFAMFSMAANYNLADKSEKLRSTSNLERLFFQLVRVFQPSLFIEAGAKDAGSSRRARKLLPESRVVAFEANPYTHKRFTEVNAGPDAGVEYLHLALSDEPGKVRFNVRTRDDGGASADGQGSLMKFKAEKNAFEEVEVSATTLDTFFPTDSYESCALWVDVEGAQRPVLEGGAQTLRNADVVMIEVEDRAFWDQEWLRPQIVSFLFDSGLVPVARCFQSRYLYNIVFVRKSLLEVDRYRWALTLFNSEAGRGRRVKSKKSKKAGRGKKDTFLGKMRRMIQA